MELGKKINERAEVLREDSWDVEALYKGWEEWHKDFSRCSGGEGPSREKRWPQFADKGVDLGNPIILKELFDAVMKQECALSTLYTYAHLRHDEDVACEQAKSAHTSVLGLLHSFKETTSWIDASLLQLPQKTLDGLLEAEELKEYRVYLRKIIRLKPHTLKIEEEKLLAYADRALETSQSVFQSLNNADLKFLPCRDAEGKIHELSHGTYQLYMKNPDRILRKEAFSHLHKAFSDHENTLCELLQGLVQKHVFIKKARNFTSCLEAALYPHEIDVSIYDSLIEAVRENLPALHEYIAFRKKTLGYPTLHVYDLSVPLVKEVAINMSYEEAVEAIIASVACLGEEYQQILRKGLLEERWVDRYENKRKRSGAYSSGSYQTKPYILMNYHGTFQDIMTLTHEAGHSMHSYFSRKHQAYQDHQYPIFLAEVASTFHEQLLFDYLVKQSKNPLEKAYLLNQKIDGIRNTLFRQVLFAEFERKIHEWVEQERPLTPALLCQEYLRLNQDYFGSALEIDKQVGHEWSRIPHFYYNFYVYQYGTGLSAAYVLAERVLSNEVGAKEAYLEFISSGGALSPMDALKRAGVDMTGSAPTRALILFFKKLNEDLKKLLE